MNRRRFLLTSFAVGFTPWAEADAQHDPALPRVGYLSNSATPKDDIEFFVGLREHGYEPGRNIIVEDRYSAGRSERVQELATELVGLRCRVIVAWGPAFVTAVTKLTTNTAIIALLSTDPVADGWAASHARPGGSITAFIIEAGDLNAKRLQFLKEIAPKIVHVALLVNPTRPHTESRVSEAKKAATALALTAETFKASAPQQFEAAFSEMTRHRVDGLLVFPDEMFYGYRSEIVRLAEQNRIPSVYWARAYVEAGGLLSYAANLPDVARRSAGYVARILKGERPGDLPIQQASKLEMCINLKTAKALGLTIPQSLLLRADQVIE